MSKFETDILVTLREVDEADLDFFFEMEQDPEAVWMAAFTAENPADEEVFRSKWAGILNNEAIVSRTILYGDQVAGHVDKFEMFSEPAVSYWIGRQFWGRGIATQALALLLALVEERPLFARAAKDNIASLRVLQKNSFTITGEDKGYANARGAEIEEYILTLQ
jgi:RimJ/RimL family protein N-acetyltransferase